MITPEVNLLHDKKAKPEKLIKPKKPKNFFYYFRFFLYPLIVILIVAVVCSSSIIFSGTSVLKIFSGSNQSLFKQIGHLVTSADKPLAGEDQDRINILLIGIGGEGHPGAYLADTIILASFKPSTKQVALLSIPRDLFVPIPGYTEKSGSWRKINYANAYGNEINYPGGGETLLAKTLEDLFKLKIPYYVRLDFTGFRKIVDDVGGLDIEVENRFTDYQYPDYNYGWQTISFDAGEQHFDGEKALQFARSRHGCCGEGSDFARSRRQQKILQAFKEKVFSLTTLINPIRISNILTDLGQHAKTNLEPWEAIRLAKLLSNLKQDQIINRTFDTSAEGLLVSSYTVDGAYILRPRAGAANFSELTALIQNIFSYQTQTAQATEPVRIEIYNGTNQTGLANKKAEGLRLANFVVLKIANAPSRDYEATVIYDLTGNQQMEALKVIRSQVGGNVTTEIPASFQNFRQAQQKSDSDLEEPDFIIILGQDNISN